MGMFDFRTILYEFEDPNDTVGNNTTEDTADDNYDMGDNGDTQTTNDTDTGNNETQDENNQDDNTDDDEYNIDYDDDTQDDNNDNTDENQDDNTDDTGDDDEYNMDDEEEGGTDTGDDLGNDEAESGDNIKDLENKIFDQLTPEQKKIKTEELKNRFVELYDRCNGIIDRINSANKSTEDAKVFEFINNTLFSLKNTCKDYIDRTFDTKSYIENNITFQKCLVVMQGINDILTTVKSSKE